MYSQEHKQYLKRIKLNKILVVFFQILIIITFIIIWEILSVNGVINNFLYSSPTNIFGTIISLIRNNNLFTHIFVTFYETIVSFILASGIGLLLAAILWWNKTLAKIFDPYLTVLNSLPKVALGPLIIIWVGANTKSIILMAFLIIIFNTIINMYNAFNSTDNNKIILFKSFKANKYKILTKLVIRENMDTLINTLKINIGMSLIGVIMGELLVSKEGIGYLIMYGSQVFNLNLIMASIILLAILSYIMYIMVNWLKKLVIKN